MISFAKPLCKTRITNDYFVKFLSKDRTKDMAKFKHLLHAAKDVVILTGSAISVESGLPTFRGNHGLWRNLQGSVLANPEAFSNDPSLVWEFYHYRRELALKAKPNAAHIAVANFEEKHKLDKTVTVITQNEDGLHAKAGTKNLLELHGSIFKTRCTKCNEVLVNTDNPICPALGGRGRGSPISEKLISDIPEKDLPHCKKPGCGGLLRPHVMWIGEVLEKEELEKAARIASKCNVCLVVGARSIAYPAVTFPFIMSACGSIVAEFNMEPTPASPKFDFYFEGPSAQTLPEALNSCD